MRRPLLLTLAAGAALSASGCGKRGNDVAAGQGTATEKPEVVATENPPAPSSMPVAESPPSKPDPIGQPVPELIGNPPPPSMETPADLAALKAIASANKALPTFASVKSPHPEGATNPPSPVLLITPAGLCFKTFEGGMIAAGPDRVQAVEATDWITPVQCPTDRAKMVFEKWIAAGKPVYSRE